ncbi:MAG TPA: DUF2283 domain-containing protein [Candidatus Nanoarchaeia archaeon]|nr:DUF2283 domain-containing protein [Candidatus Nanoarchaeia archaeon]
MKNKKITIDYDKEADVLYVSLGDPIKAVTEEVDNVGIRIDENTNEIVGFTVINFIKSFKKNSKPIEINV